MAQMSFMRLSENRCHVCVFAVVLACLGGAQAAETKAQRPNILLLLADNWAWPHASAYGDPVVVTPVFDRLAEEGVLFNHAYCQVPSCSPARAVLLTGQASHRLRDAANLWSSWPHSLKTYPELLEDSGYSVGYEIKGWGPGVVFQKSNARRNRNPSGRKFASFSDFLDSTPNNQPFCYWLGSHNPHQPWTAKPEFKQGMDPAKIRLPEYLPDSPEVRDTVIEYYAEVRQFDQEAGEALAELERRGLADNTLVVMMGDNGWQTPRGLANVYDAGTRTCMTVRWPGMVKTGSTTDRFVSFEDIAPTFLTAAGLKPDRAMTGRNLLPLLQGKAKVKWRDAIFLERERHANVRDGDASYPCRAIRTGEFLYVWNLEPDLWPAGDPQMHYAVGPYGDVDNTPFKAFLLANRNTPTIKRYFELGFGKRPEEELYDLRTDPDQVRNVAHDPRHIATLKSLRQRVRQWMKDTADPRARSGAIDPFDAYKYFGSPPKQRK
jgi:N-sulfoglucosamine sulfohydrolase